MAGKYVTGRTDEGAIDKPFKENAEDCEQNSWTEMGHATRGMVLTATGTCNAPVDATVTERVRERATPSTARTTEYQVLSVNACALVVAKYVSRAAPVNQ